MSDTVSSMNALRFINSSRSGIISLRTAEENGISYHRLKKFVDNGTLYRSSHGLYMRRDAAEDEFLMLQSRWSRAVFSHETALYLLGYADHSPAQYTITCPKGYNVAALTAENVRICRVLPKNYSLGLTEASSPYGNSVKTFCIERTLCDIVRGAGIDIAVVNKAMKQYAAFDGHNIDLLMSYAEALRVVPKVRRYMEILL